MLWIQTSRESSQEDHEELRVRYIWKFVIQREESGCFDELIKIR